MVNPKTKTDESELIGCLIDTIEDWLFNKGFTHEDVVGTPPKTFTEEDILITGDDYNHLANKFKETLELN